MMNQWRVDLADRFYHLNNDYFPLARAMPSRISLWASSAPPQRSTLTHLPGSRSL